LTFKRGFHLQILFKNQISGVTEPKTTIDSHSLGKNPNKQFFDEGENDTHLWDFTLAQLREQLGKKVDAKWSFCLENCAPVDDSSTLCYYLTLPESNVKLLQEPLPDKDGKLTEAAVPSLLSVYMAVGNAMAPAAKGFGAEWAEKHPVNMALTDRSKAELAAPTVPANHKAEYGPEAAWTVANVAPGANGMLDCVVDFAESDWDKIMMINKSLYAFDVRGKRLEVTSARLPAFELKGIKDDVQIPGNHLRQFVEIRDTPHIDITEVSSEFQSSLVDNAFSARSLEAMVSGGTPLVSASVSAGIKSESSKGSGSNEGSQRREYRATYNFPRVSLFLDEYTLKVSKYCDEALKALKSAPTIDNLRQFQRRFGVIFAQEVTLGGRLESTKAADSSFSAENSSVKDALKASLGAAFSYGPASASANASMENQVGHDAGKNNQKASSAISYTARGGDTLLCAK